MKIAINHHGPFTTRWDAQWNTNPYNKRNGGWLNHHGEAMTDPKTIELFKQRTRYCIARYGAYDNMFAWVLWIENDVVNSYASQRRDWHKLMAEYVHDVDFRRHPVTTEFVSSRGDSQTWELDGIDYTQLAAYTTTNLINTFRTRANTLLKFNKPATIEEYGGSAHGSQVYHLAYQIHNGPWIGWHLPLAGTPMPWWWNLIFDDGWNLDAHWKIFADFVEGEDLRDINWYYDHNVRLSNGGQLTAMTRQTKDRGYAWISDQQLVNKVYRPMHMFKKDDSYAELWEPVNGATLTLRKMQDGIYDIEFWDTWNGDVQKSLARCKNGNLTIELPMPNPRHRHQSQTATQHQIHSTKTAGAENQRQQNNPQTAWD